MNCHKRAQDVASSKKNLYVHRGLLRRKTRVLVTHGVGFLPEVDRIVVMKEGGVSEQGSYRELLEREGEFSQFLVQYLAGKVMFLNY